MIKKVKLVDAQGNEIGTFDVGQLTAALAALLELSAKDNLNISSPKSINLEPTKHVKIKPGDGGQIELLPDHTGDYRFKKDAMVLAVTRGTMATDSETGKTDYPTQDDDFKDIPVSVEGNACTFNESTGEWEVPSGDTAILGCTWEDIIKAVLFLKGNGSIS